MAIDRTVAPPISDINSFNIIKAQKTILENGIPLYQVFSENTELVKIEFMFFAGNWFQQTPITAFAVNNMLIEGTTKYTSAQIAELVEYTGAFIGYNIDKDNAYISVFTMSKFLPEVLPLFEEIIKNTTFPEHEVIQFKNKQKQQFLVEQTKVKNIAGAEHARMMFGNVHPYGYMIVEEDFDNLTREDMVEFHHKFYNSSNCAIITSGATNKKDIILIEKYFGKGIWNDTNGMINVDYKKSSGTERKIYIEKPGVVQSAIRIGKELFTKIHPDYAAMSVVNCILGGYFGSRLMKSIREEKGYTYGINSLFVTFLHAGYLSIISEVGANVTKPAIFDIYAEIDRLRTEIVAEAELKRVKNYMLGEVVRMFDGPFAQAESLLSLLEYNFGYEYFDHYIETVKSITSIQIKELAYKYLDPASLYEVVVGKID